MVGNILLDFSLASRLEGESVGGFLLEFPLAGGREGVVSTGDRTGVF